MNSNGVQHVFIIGSKSIGQYGGYETFVDKLTEQHQDNHNIKYHIACKANGEGYMDESKLDVYSVIKTDLDGAVSEFEYHNAHVFKIKCLNIGPAAAIFYDKKAVLYCIDYCVKNSIKHPIFYILTCRIGIYINSLVNKIKAIGGKFYLNPDGHEWKRAKWSAPVRKYWKWSEKKMVNAADLIICDSENIEKYIYSEYSKTNTTFIAYGADILPSTLSEEDPKFVNWLNEKQLEINEYYLVVGRFVPENNFETMISEFMLSKSKKSLALITNTNDRFREVLDKKLHYTQDPRIKFVGTVYDKQLLKKIREKAYGYLHGHEVGGTNPSLLEAMGSTRLNLLLDVGFNREVGLDSALYWSKEIGDLASLIDKVEGFNIVDQERYGLLAKDRISSAYSWKFIGDEYLKVFTQQYI